MPYWDNYGVTKSQYDKGDFTKSTDRNVRNLATGKTGVSASELAARNAREKAAKEKAKKEKKIKAHKTWITDTKEKKKKKTKHKKKIEGMGFDEFLKFGKGVQDYYKNLEYQNKIKEGKLDFGQQEWQNLIVPALMNSKYKDKDKVSSLNIDTPIQVAELTESQKNWIDKELNNLKRGFKEPQHVYETINNPALGKFEKNTLNPFKDPQEPTTPKEFMDYLKEKAPDSNFPTVTAVGAEGGVARKKYNQGSNGILDLDETEGEEISLTAFNPNFDEIPQLTNEERLQIDSEEKEPGEKRIDLFSETDESDPLNQLLLAEDGITTLFRAKNGGNATKNIKGQPHMLAYITPGEAKTLENLGGQKTMTEEGIPAYPYWDDGSGQSKSQYDSGATSSDSGWSNNDWGSDQEDDVAQMESDMGVTTDHSPDWTGSDRGWVEPEDDRPGEKIGIHDNRTARDRAYDFDFMYGHKVKPKDQWNEHNKRNAWTEKKQLGKEMFDAFKFGIGPISILKFGWAQNKKKKAEKEHLQQMIDDMKAAGDTAFNPHTDTALQLAEQLMIDLNTPRKDEDTGGDGQEVVPVHEEIQEYEEMAWDPMSYLDKIRAKQAQRASLVEKGIIQDNETMTLNSGGLANLFRVKNY